MSICCFTFLRYLQDTIKINQFIYLRDIYHSDDPGLIPEKCRASIHGIPQKWWQHQENDGWRRALVELISVGGEVGGNNTMLT
jgi:hypothetical protein